MLLLVAALLAAPIHYSADPNFCIDVANGTAQNNQKIQLYRCNGSKAQNFDVVPLGATSPVPAPVPVTGAKPSDASQVDAATPQKAGYHVAFSDEFTGTALDLTKWNLIVDGSGGGNNEEEFYTPFPANHTVADGLLTIHAKRGSFLGMPWTSAKLNTLGLFDFTYGYIEARLKVPQGQGAWPAFWMMPKDSLWGIWPTSGEIDIMEILGGAPNQQHTTLHFGKNWPNQEQIGGTVTATPGTDFSQDFHTYGVDWQPDHMDFYLDGKIVYSVKSTDAQWHTDAQGAPASSCSGGWPFCEPFYLILNLAVGGAWPGPSDPTRAAFDFAVDWVRVYQKE